MKKLLRTALAGTAVGTLALVACDQASPPNTPPQPVAAEAIPESETLVEVVRAALAAAVRDKDPYARARRLGSLLPTLGADTVLAAKQTLQDSAVDMQAAEIELLVRYWATHQPEAAARWAVSESPLNYRTEAVYSALSVWAQADPQAAVENTWKWAGFPTLDSIVPVAIMRGWYARGEPTELRRFLRGLHPDVLAQRAIAAYIRALVQDQGFEAVRSWAETLPVSSESDKIYKLTVFRRVTDALSQMDVDAAVVWCDRHCSGPYGGNMASLIGRNWALRDGAAALAWLEGRKPGYETDLAVQLTWALWARTDLEAAMAWMAEQTATEAPDWLQPTYPYYATMLSGKSPLDGLAWAERIANDQEREITLIDIARHWRSTDEAAAEAWLLQSPLSEPARERARVPLPVAPSRPSLQTP